MRRPHLVLSFHEASLVLWNIIPEKVPPLWYFYTRYLKIFHHLLLSGAVEGGQEEAVKFFEAWKAQVKTII